jgi:HemY protein
MRATIWFVLLFAVAVVAATTLGTNDGLVTFYWGAWRLDLSLNLFLLVLIGTCFLLVTLFQAIDALIGLPRRAREWRVARRDRTAQALLRDALAQYFGGRYSRAQKSAQRALAIQADTPELAQDNEFTVLAHLLAAGSAHRLQDRVGRDEELRRALDLSHRSAAARSAEEGARLLAAEWALDDRDAARALELLEELPMGVARRTHSLRLKLQAAKLAGRAQDALKTARLLVKHQGFSKVAAQGLLRSLASESLAHAHDVGQLRRNWLLFDPVDRRDAFVAACAASRAVALGAPEEARVWLRPFWEQLGELGEDERAAVAEALVQASAGLGPEWLPRLESATQAFPRDDAIALAVGIGLVERQLWGKARRPLEQAAAADVRLSNTLRRKAWVALARLAQEEGDAARAAQCFEAAAQLP